MNRSRRGNQNKQFVSGGVYDPRLNFAGQPGISGIPQQQNLGQETNGRKTLEQQHRNGQQQAPPLEPPPQPPVMVDETAENNKVDDNALYDESGKLQYKNIFRTRKKSSVRAKEKKIRQNRQLRKTLIPKNALMALNEVVGITISEFNINNAAGGGFVATVTVNEKQYEGKGPSKIAAKNNASEKALRDYVLDKMREKPRLRKNSSANSINNDDDMGANNDTASNNADDGEQDTDNASAPTAIDDVPMVNLASFAIYKLFTEWENEGYLVPELRVCHPLQPGGSSTEGSAADGSAEVKKPKTPPIRTELPNNWEAIHPSTLLCMMRPGLQYRELGTVGEMPNVLQRMGVTVNDVNYVSSGRSKKLARRNVAVCVLNKLFSTNFLKEQPCEDE